MVEVDARAKVRKVNGRVAGLSRVKLRIIKYPQALPPEFSVQYSCYVLLSVVQLMRILLMKEPVL